jgi:ABC-type phosphate transport system ATPase subunit
LPIRSDRVDIIVGGSTTGATVAFVGCGEYINADASATPYGALKRLEIALALAAEPKIILLDLLDQLQHDMNINEQQPDEMLYSNIFDYIQHFPGVYTLPR